jgi:hypothetical protein
LSLTSKDFILINSIRSTTSLPFLRKKGTPSSQKSSKMTPNSALWARGCMTSHFDHSMYSGFTIVEGD